MYIEHRRNEYLLVHEYLAVVVQAIEDEKAHVGVLEFGFLESRMALTNVSKLSYGISYINLYHYHIIV